MSTFSKRIIICGTDTDVGKTIVSSFLVQGLKGIYWKPIQSGTEEGTDTKTVCNLLSLEPNSYLPERYKFKAPVSPHCCLLYTSDAADDMQCVDLGGRRII